MILAGSLRELSIVEGRRGDRSIKQLVARHPQSGSRERGMQVLSPFSPLYAVQDPTPRMAPSALRVGLPKSVKLLQKPLPRMPKVCLLVRFCQASSHY